MMLGFIDILLTVLFIVISILLIIIVLLQKGRGGGLSSMFAGGGASSAFGTRTGDVFTWVTIVLTAMFLLLAVATTMVFRSRSGVAPARVEAPADTAASMPAPGPEQTLPVDNAFPSGTTPPQTTAPAEPVK